MMHGNTKLKFLEYWLRNLFFIFFDTSSCNIHIYDNGCVWDRITGWLVLHCARRRKVADSIPDCVFGIFIDI